MRSPIIQVGGLGKAYRLGEAIVKHAMFRDVVISLVTAPLRRLRGATDAADADSLFWALRDVTFDVQQGEVVGIIGRNGAGKSTLLKVLSRITEPTNGEVRLRGRVASLLEVGTGFHPELTGRENIYLNGAILGMSKMEMDRKFDEIVAFAEVERFLDTPVKRYSSGMYVRLAFAVAAHIEPEILIVDEVLAVGDVAFQKKCLGKMQEVARGSGRTILFVSHNMAAIQSLTTRVIVLADGVVSFDGKTPEGVGAYHDALASGSGNGTVLDVRQQRRRFPELHREVEFHQVELLGTTTRNYVEAGSAIRIRITLQAAESVSRFRVGLTVFDLAGSPVGSTFTNEVLRLSAGQCGQFEIQLEDSRLAPGKYACAMSVGTGNHETGLRDFDIIFDAPVFEDRPERNRSGRDDQVANAALGRDIAAEAEGDNRRKGNSLVNQEFTGYARHYRKWHDDSERHLMDMRRHYAWLFGNHVPRNQDIRALDVGCGMGFALDALRALGYSDLTGIDIDEEQVASCREKGLSVTLVNSATEYLLENVDQFDLILLLDVLEHVRLDEQLNLCRAMLRALRRNGKLLLTVPNANSALASRWRYIDYTHHMSFTEHSLDFLLSSAGFVDIQVMSTDRQRAWPRPRNWIGRWPFSRWFWMGIGELAAFHMTRAFRRVEMFGELGTEGLQVPLSLNLLATCRRD